MPGRIVTLLAGLILMVTASVRAEPPSEREMAARIDAQLAAVWTREHVQLAPPADDAEFLRRAWLDLCGVIPPLNDADGISGIRNFLEATDPDKRIRLIERLLAKPSHATHFCNLWKNVLLPADSNVPQLGGDVLFQSWLRGQFADNVPYDRMASDLLLAKGPANQSGPALYYLALQLKPEELAASTSRVFLGTQIQCAQCHDHPFDHWKKKDFWGYAAFFARLMRPGERMNQPLAFQVLDAERGEVTIPGTTEVVAPQFLGGEVSADEAGTERRERLVQWLTARDNPYFARAAVNRVWALLFGRGLVHPLDDFGKHNAASHPTLLDELEAYFVQTGYDVNRLIRVLAQTRAYQLSSRSTAGGDDRPEFFGRMAIKSLSAEQLYDCLIEAMRRRETVVPGGARFSSIQGFDPVRQTFLARFRAPGQGATEYEGGVPLALTLMNGATTRQATDLSQSDLLVALDAPFFSNEERVEVLFLSTLSRPPTSEEREQFVSYVEKGQSGTGRRQALSDILWALLNTAEFALNH
jgi:hypothetical protein